MVDSLHYKCSLISNYRDQQNKQQVHLLSERVKMKLQTSEDERELGWSNHNNISLFHSPTLHTRAALISNRLAQLYQALSDLFEIDPQRDQDQHFARKTQQHFTLLSYSPAPFEGPICNRDTEPKSMFCFDCNLNKNTNSIVHIYCAECFIEEQHRGHYYTVDIGQKGLCDCGSDFLAPQSCCPKHRNWSGKALPLDKDAETYQKELQFLLYFLLRVKREKSNEAFKYGVVWENLLKKMVAVTSKSYLYQLKTSEIYIKPLSEGFKYEIRPVIEIVFSQKWANSTLLLFNQLHLQLYPIKIARKKILMELLKFYSSPFESYQSLDTFSKVFFQFAPMETTILKLLKKNIVKPIACYQPREDYLDCLNVHILVYYWYDNLSKNQMFPEILKTVFEKTPIRYFFNIPPCHLATNDQTKKQKNLFQQFYIRNLIVFGLTLAKMDHPQHTLTKLIRECYHIAIQAEEDTLFCAQRTLGVFLLIHFRYDLTNLLHCSLNDLKELLALDENFLSNEYLDKLVGQLLLFIVTMVQDSFEIVPQSTGISTNYCFSLFFILFIHKLQEERKDPERVLSKLLTQMKEKVSAQVERCLNLVNLSEEEFNENNLINQIELNTNVEAICKEGIKVILFIYGVLTSLETRYPEVVVANLLGNPDEQYIKNYYKQLALLAPGKTLKEFKGMGEAWIANEQLLEEFIVQDLEGIRNPRGEEEGKWDYFSGISFYSQYTGNQLNEQNTLRLKMKLNSKGTHPSPYQEVLDSIFDHSTCMAFLDFYSKLIRIMASKWLSNCGNARQHLRIATSLMVDLFAERKIPEYKELVMGLKGKIESDPEFAERLDSIILVLEEKQEREPPLVKEGPQEAQGPRSLKKIQIMKELKEKQNEFLSQASPLLQSEEADTCIICRECRSEEPLQYLCRMKFNNVLNYLILEKAEPVLMITTCGHKIHEKCLAENIQGNNQYGAKYHCFLCKRASNLRLPMIDAKASLTCLQKIIEELLTVVVLQFEGNQLLGQQIPEGQRNLNQFFFFSLAYQTYLYRPCFQKLFKQYMLPIYDLILQYLIAAQKEPELNSNYREIAKSNKDQGMAAVLEILTSIIEGKVHPQGSYADYVCGVIEQKGLWKGVRARIQWLKNREINDEGEFDISPFSIPKELYQLSVSARKCSKCLSLSSRLRACLYCGFKACPQCQYQLFRHRNELHLGTHMVVQLFNGCLCYQTMREEGKVSMTVDYLYKNYAGEELPSKFKGPLKRDKYRLDVRCWQKALDDMVLSNVEEMVDQKMSHQQQINCAVQ